MKKYILSALLVLIAGLVNAQLSSNALYFDGVDDIAKIPLTYSSPFFLGTGDFTVEAWINDQATPGGTSEEVIFSCYPTVSLIYGFILSIQNGHPVFYVNALGSGPNFTGDLRDGQCHYLAFIRQSGAISWYIDGVYYNTGANQPDSLNIVDTLLIGTWGNASIGYTTNFKGLIKEIRFWNVARTQTEIQNNMNFVISNTFTIPSLIGYWRCSEGTGSAIADISTSGNSGFRGDGSGFSLNTEPQWATGCLGCTPPSAMITAGGPTTFCSGGSVVLNAPTGANKTYQWKKGANLISGASLSSYTATTGGNYRVIVTNTISGCSKTTASATVVTINTLPAATITPQEPTTFCAGGSVVLKANSGAGLTYKWKKGGNYISGAPLLNYTATTGGNYKVQVTNSNGCSKTSGNVVVSVPCKEGESGKVRKWESEMNVSVFPNPNSGEFTIKFSSQPTSPIQIELTDDIGKVVKRFETTDETVVIKESNLVIGIYCLTVRNKDEVVVRKINVLK